MKGLEGASRYLLPRLLLACSSRGPFYQPTGDGRWAANDPADIGALAVKTLTESGHEGKAFTLSGPESLDAVQYREEALGRDR